MRSWPWTRACGRQGLSAPRIYGEDLEAGLLIVEDLGSEPVVDASGPIPERYAEATRVLAKLHTTDLAAGVFPSATATSTSSRPTISKRC